MNFKNTAAFDKDLKKLFRKYKSLEEDLSIFKKTVVHVDVQRNHKFAILHQNDKLWIIKARFFCKYLRGKTLRIIYAQYINEVTIEFIELFYKGDKGREDEQRIKDYLIINNI